MKRFLTYFLTGAAVLGLFLGASVFIAKAYVIQPGDTLSALASRFGTTVDKLAADNNIVNKNLIIAGKTLDVGGEQMLGAAAGYTPITGYESRTTQYITASAATIPVASTKDPSGAQIDLTNISPSGTVSVFMSLEPGTTREEPIKCTGVTASSWTGCTRGLPFQGGSETASSTLQKAHNAGSKIIITNVGQFYNQYVNIDGAQTVYGLKTFFAIPKVTSTTALPVSADQLVTKYYADTVVSTGFTSANIDATSGLKAAGTAPEKVQMNASSTGGISFDAGGAAYFNGVVNTSTIFNAQTVHNGATYVNTPTGNAGLAVNEGFVDRKYVGDGSDGTVTVSANTTLTRDMFYDVLTINAGATMTSAGFRIYAKTSATINGAIVATGTAGGNGSGSTGGTAGAGAASGTIGGGGIGAAGVGDAGGSPAAGLTAPAVLSMLGNTGGAGGGGLGLGAGSGGGNRPSLSSPSSTILGEMMIDTSSTYSLFKGGSGGGSGEANNSGAVASASGGGGGGGGIIWITSPLIAGTGQLWVSGGNGGNGVGAGLAGGGGGGGGGAIILRYVSKTFSGNEKVSGGTKGTGTTGTAVDGTAGRTWNLPL